MGYNVHLCFRYVLFYHNYPVRVIQSDVRESEVLSPRITYYGAVIQFFFLYRSLLRVCE